MSIEAMTLVLNHSRATGRAKLVLIGIANHQGDQGAWPSIETLARYANASERSVIRDIQDLEALGELIVERNAAPIRGQYRPNLYWVNVQPAGVTDLSTGVTDSTSGVTGQVVRGDTVVTLNVINPKENRKEEYPQAELEEAFEEFWNAYPRKVEKIAARKAFIKQAETVTPGVITAGARRMANDPNLPPKQYIPYPASWLNAGGWDSEPYPERERTKEELEAIRAKEIERRREIDLREAAERREQARLEAERLAANPVTLCEHNRVKVICPICSKNV